ncbi:MAG: hypothetical protein IKC61_03120 [Clostridia bacterium]|nr:hypothetical protein [Clostridia bacterium]
MAEIKKKAKRKLYFRVLKKIMKIRYKEPKFVYLGEQFVNGALILSNHEGTDSPMSLEIYCDKPTRMWGAYEMNSGLVKLYKYQTKIYYHEKKHWNIHLARLFCLIASPLTWLFYSGFDLISVYRDARLIRTLRESVRALESGDNIVIFPEDSRNGYLSELEGFHEGFILLAELCERRGIDLPIYVSYFRKSDKTYIFDAPVKYSELSEKYKSREEISRYLCERCNAIGKMQFDEDGNQIDTLKQSN